MPIYFHAAINGLLKVYPTIEDKKLFANIAVTVLRYLDTMDGELDTIDDPTFPVGEMCSYGVENYHEIETLDMEKIVTDAIDNAEPHPEFNKYREWMDSETDDPDAEEDFALWEKIVNDNQTHV